MHLTSTDARVCLTGHLRCLAVGALLLSVCVASCAVREEGVLSAHVRQEMVRPPGEEHEFVREGVSRLVFMIENDGDDVIVLRRCSIPCTASTSRHGSCERPSPHPSLQRSSLSRYRRWTFCLSSLSNRRIRPFGSCCRTRATTISNLRKQKEKRAVLRIPASRRFPIAPFAPCWSASVRMATG